MAEGQEMLTSELDTDQLAESQESLTRETDMDQALSTATPSKKRPARSSWSSEDEEQVEEQAVKKKKLTEQETDTTDSSEEETNDAADPVDLTQDQTIQPRHSQEPNEFYTVQSRKNKRMYSKGRKFHQPSGYEDLPRYEHPIILEDLGRTQTKYSRYALDVNTIWHALKIGSIRGQRPIGMNGRKWILDCGSEKQQRAISRITELKAPDGNIFIRCTVPRPRVAGVIKGVSLDIPASDLKHHMTTYNKYKRNSEPEMADIFRLQNKEGKSTNVVKCTFHSKTLPTRIQLGACNFEVQPFQPWLKRCLKCQKLGHTKKTCNSRPKCDKCGHNSHPKEETCLAPKSEWYCLNCNKKGHASSSSHCPERKIWIRALGLKAAHYMPMGTALVEARQELNHDSTPARQSRSVAEQAAALKSPPIQRENYKCSISRPTRQNPLKSARQEPTILLGLSERQADSSQLTFLQPSVVDIDKTDPKPKTAPNHPTQEKDTITDKMNKMEAALEKCLDQISGLNQKIENMSNLRKEQIQHAKNLIQDTSRFNGYSVAVADMLQAVTEFVETGDDATIRHLVIPHMDIDSARQMRRDPLKLDPVVIEAAKAMFPTQ